MAWAIVIDGAATELVVGQMFLGAPFQGPDVIIQHEDGSLEQIPGTMQRNQHGMEVFTLWTEQERAAIGVFEVIELDPVPPGKREKSRGLTVQSGLPVRTRVLEDIPLDEYKASKRDALNSERDALIEGGFTHVVRGTSYTFQSRQSDRENLATMGMQAQLAKAGGAQSGNYRWHLSDPQAEGATDFEWITANNERVKLDAPEMVALFQAGIAFKSAKTFYARDLKTSILTAGSHASVNLLMDGRVWP